MQDLQASSLGVYTGSTNYFPRLLETFQTVNFMFRQATKNQEEGKTTVIEMMVTKELGDPFRRDAMKLPVRHLTKYLPTMQVNESASGQPTDL